LDALTDSQEKARAQPWRVADAPADFIAAQMRAIVGVEIPIARIEGKWKVSQNRTVADRRGVAEGLAGENGDAVMAGLVARRGGLE
jgi:transcriptional regulator